MPLKLTLPKPKPKAKIRYSSGGKQPFSLTISKELQDICSDLSHNRTGELSLGYAESKFLFTKREANAIAQALQHNQSVTSVTIGWHFRHDPLITVLKQVAKLRITCLKLVLVSWLPRNLLLKLMSIPSLIKLDIRDTYIRVKSVSERTYGVAPIDVDDSVVSLIYNLSPTVSTLQFTSCNMTEDSVKSLCSYLQHQSCVFDLSLRQNHSIKGGWDQLFKLSKLKRLDLSLCDLDAADGFAIAKALEHGQGDLNTLVLAGNYRLGPAIPVLLEVATRKLNHIDVSFCEVHGKALNKVWDVLCRNPNDHVLRTLLLQGSRLKDAKSLANCIRQNTSLRSIALNQPKDPNPLCLGHMRDLVDAMQDNYSLEEFHFDEDPYVCGSALEEYNEFVDELVYLTTLNKCGRRILKDDFGKRHHKFEQLKWPNVLAAAAALDDINYLHWLVTHGTQKFGG